MSERLRGRYDAAMPTLRALARSAAGYASIALGALDVTAGRALRGPLYAQLSIADPCNHRCVMCPYHPPGKSTRALLPQFGGDAPGMMSLERYRAVIADLARLGTRRVDLVGRGEPLLPPHVVEMVALARDAGLEVSLTTNGSRLDEAMVAGLAEAGLDRMKISLNAGRAATYPTIHVTESEDDYAAVLEGARRVARTRVHLTLSFTISRINQDELARMVERAIEHGADAAYFQHLIPVPDRPDLSLAPDELLRLASDSDAAIEHAQRAGLETNLASFAEEARSAAEGAAPDEAIPCYVGYYFTVVLGNGNVMPCCQVERPIGDLDASSFGELWNGEAYRRFREAARRLPVRGPELETAECERCYFRPHNLSIHRAVRPLSAASGNGFSLDQALRMARTDRSTRE